MVIVKTFDTNMSLECYILSACMFSVGHKSKPV